MNRLVELGRSLCILYVEDDPLARDSMKRILGRFVPTLLVANDGKEGLVLYKEHRGKIDFVITDISMPKLNGIDMIERIKELDPSIHSAIISAHNDTENLVRAIELQVEYFLIKPVGKERILSVLETVFQRIRDEQELRSAREREENSRLLSALEISLEGLLEYNPLPSLVLDEDDNILFANEEFRALFDPEADATMLERLEEGALCLRDMIEPKELFENPLIDWKASAATIAEESGGGLELLVGGGRCKAAYRLREVDGEDEKQKYVCVFAVENA